MDPITLLLALALSLAAGATLYWVAGSVGRNVKAARVGACVVALLLFGVLVAPRKAPLEERGADWRPEIKPVSGYTGSSACASCHPGEHATWKASYHRTMTQLATPESVIPPFDGRTLAWGPRKTVLERRGDEYWVQLYDYARPDPIEGEWRRIVMTTGSHTVQHYWAQTGHARIIERMPFAYYIPQERWIPLEAAFIQPPDSFIPLGGWNDNCLACHSTNPRPHVEELNTQVSELGIACEACHGPGAEHVDRYRAAPLARYIRYLTDGDDDSIVNPRKLDHRRSTEICGQCHGLRFLGPTEELAYAKTGYTYRPGDELNEATLVVQYPLDDAAVQDLIDRDPGIRKGTLRLVKQRIERAYPPKDGSHWPDGRPLSPALELNALLDSACYTKGEMHCGSCHTMHQPVDDPRSERSWANDQLGVGMDGDAACVSCHAESEYSRTEHTHHTEASSGSACLNCHMPYQNYGILKGIRTHTIKSPNVQESVETGRPNACNQCHLDMTLAWAAERLETWYGIEPPVLDEDQTLVSASVLWLLRGNAGQRALAAWSLGWPEARDASGLDWMAPLLIQLLNDPYHAVRLIAHRSISDLPGFENFQYEFLAPSKARMRAQEQALATWQDQQNGSSTSPRAAVLLGDDGQPNWPKLKRLLSERDDREMRILE